MDTTDDTGTTAVADPAAAAELDAQIAELQRQRAALEPSAQVTDPGTAELTRADAGGAGTFSDYGADAGAPSHLEETTADVDAQVGRADPLNTGQHLEGEPAEPADVDAQVADTANAPVATHADGEPSEAADVRDPAPVEAAPTPPERS